MAPIGWRSETKWTPVTATEVELFGKMFYDINISSVVTKSVEDEIVEQFPSIIPDMGYFSRGPAKGRITAEELTAFYLAFPELEVHVIRAKPKPDLIWLSDSPS